MALIVVPRYGIARVLAACAIGWLLAGTTAADMDCPTARNSAEAAICGNKELMALDKQLNEAYKQALEQSSSPDWLEKDQRKWLKKRDRTASSGAEWLHTLYQDRIETLQCEPWRKLSNTVLTEPKTDPAYPDVWDFVPPKGEELHHVVLLPDGDVGLELYNPKTDTMRAQRMFFDRPLSFDDRCRIRENIGMPPFGPAPLTNGHAVMSVGFGGVRPNGCYAGLESNVVIYANQDLTNILVNKTLLYLLNKPVHWQTKPGCYEGPSFDYRVVSLGHLKFVPLPDGTFLVVQLFGDFVGISDFVVRFDEQFQSRSHLLNDRLFVVDGIDESASKYGDRASGDLSLWKIQRDLYRRLMDIKNGRK